jgi:hypothetical protein
MMRMRRGDWVGDSWKGLTLEDNLVWSVCSLGHW